MNSKSLLIPVAAFAVAVTGVQAYDATVLEKAGLDETQIDAFETAKELRAEGDREAARDVLIEAGIDDEIMQAIRETMRQQRDAHHAQVEDALAKNDFAAFKVAVVGSPLADIITTEADFALFKEAHEHRESARDIMAELGLEGKEKGSLMGHGQHRGGFGHGHDDE